MSILSCKRPLFGDSHACLVYLVSHFYGLVLSIVEILVLFIINDPASKLCMWLPITYRILGLVALIELHQFGHALRLSLRTLFVLIIVMDLKMLLPGHKVTLMCILSLYSPWHILLPPIVTDVGSPRKLVGQSLFAHVLLDSVNYLNDIVDILFEFLTFLETVHRNHLCFLICNSIKVSQIWLSRSAIAALQVDSFWNGVFYWSSLLWNTQARDVPHFRALSALTLILFRGILISFNEWH